MKNYITTLCIASCLFALFLAFMPKWAFRPRVNPATTPALKIDADIFKQTLSNMTHGEIIIFCNGSVEFKRYDK